MYNVGLLKMRLFSDEYGCLTPIEAKKDIPFDIKRVYYISKVDQQARRGFHSHRQLHQVLICLNGSVDILVKTPFEEAIITLSDSTEGLYIGPLIWREMFHFSEGAVLLVLASEHHDTADYIRDFDEYKQIATDYFGRR